jgi:hypothetical protein
MYITDKAKMAPRHSEYMYYIMTLMMILCKSNNIPSKYSVDKYVMKEVGYVKPAKATCSPLIVMIRTVRSLISTYLYSFSSSVGVLLSLRE